MGFPPDVLQYVKKKGKCCNCGRPLKTTKWISFFQMNKKATWTYPVWGNMIVPGSLNRAMAVVCAQCRKRAMTKKAKPFLPKHAIEVQLDLSRPGTGLPFSPFQPNGLVYHKVQDLEDVFEITPEMVHKAELEHWHKTTGGRVV